MFSLTRSLRLALTPWYVSIGAAGALTGCASAPDLTLTSVEHHQAYRQDFKHAYIARCDNGDIDVVLDDAKEPAVKPAVAPACRQVMHIHIVWTPTSDMRAVVSNASVKWYVIGSSAPRDVLEYSGIAFVSMDDGDEQTTLRIRNALLRPSTNHGSLNDPIGAAQLEGGFVAQTNPARVKQILADLKSTLAAASAVEAPTVTSTN